VLLPDVNVVLAAFREDHVHHRTALEWVEAARRAPGALGVADIVLASVVRLATNPRVFRQPSSTDEVLGFLDVLLDPPAQVVSAGPNHWGTFRELCRVHGLRGNDVPDAHLATLALAQRAELVTFDSGFARYEGLRWRHLRPGASPAG
jgi:uncharacterized protein